MFKWTISQHPFQCEFETGSISEAAGILTDNASVFAEIFNLASSAVGEGGTPEGETASNAAESATAARRGRKPKAATAAALAPPAVAAPAPIPVPTTGAPAAGTDGLDIPANLRRNPDNSLPSAPPPPAMPAPAAPPIAPAAPPAGVLAEKIVAELDRRKAGAADDGKSLSDWLASSGFVIPGVPYAEAVSVLRVTADEKLRALLQPLGLAA